MSEETLNNTEGSTKEKQTVYEIEVIPPEVMIKVQISGLFYARFNQYLINYYKIPSNVNPEEFVKRAMNPDTPDKTEDEFHYETLMGFLVGLEQEAREQKLTKIVKYDTVTNSIIPEETQPDPQASSDTQSPDSTPPSNNQQTT
jgi:hypothetical protein